jgi:acetyl-CoA decarbonylase/synthase complex subunit gamma
MASNLDMETMLAAMYVAKYGGIVTHVRLLPANLFPLLLERLNIFTDPQRPMTVTEGIYPINNPDENSRVLVTTNFALTYFIVSGEIEGQQGAHLAADQGLRGPVRTDRLGRRQVRR